MTWLSQETCPCSPLLPLLTSHLSSDLRHWKTAANTAARTQPLTHASPLSKGPSFLSREGWKQRMYQQSEAFLKVRNRGWYPRQLWGGAGGFRAANTGSVVFYPQRDLLGNSISKRSLQETSSDKSASPDLVKFSYLLVGRKHWYFQKLQKIFI